MAGQIARFGFCNYGEPSPIAVCSLLLADITGVLRDSLANPVPSRLHADPCREIKNDRSRASYPPDR